MSWASMTDVIFKETDSNWNHPVLKPQRSQDLAPARGLRGTSLAHVSIGQATGSCFSV